MSESATAPRTPSSEPVILGLTGFARSGKDSVGRILVERHGFRRVAFGDTLKQIAEDIDPVIEYRVEGDVLGVPVRQARVSALLAAYGGWEGAKDAVPESRQFLVDLGNSLRVRIPGVEIAASFGSVQPGERVVNTNVYHPEEIDAIRAMGGVVIRVERPDWAPANPDEARTARHRVDVTLVNDGDFVALAAAVADVWAGLNVGAVARALAGHRVVTASDALAAC